MYSPPLAAASARHVSRRVADEHEGCIDDADQAPISKCGAYIAHHPWLNVEFGPGELHKVGHTGDLGRRLLDDAYTTNFPPEKPWRYITVFELATKEEAFLLETAILYCCRHRRLGSRELVRLGAPQLAEIAMQAAAALGLCPVRRDAPIYSAPGRAKKPASGAGPEPKTAPERYESPAWPARRSAVEHLTVVDGRGAQAPPDMAGFVDDILTWDFSAVVPPTPVAPPAPVVAVPTPVVATRGSATTPPSSQDDMLLDELEDDFVTVESPGAKTSPYDIAGGAAPRPTFELRDYQREATALCIAELRLTGRAILQMACRCGKTPVAYGVICAYLGEGAPCTVVEDRPVCGLLLVPGLSLLRQTAQKLAGYGAPWPLLLVGSDPRPVLLGDGRELLMTTDPAAVRAFVGAPGRRLVISTYQSSAQVPTDAFVVTVYDEAHRVCGGRAPRPFNHAILAPRVGARFFVTATPANDVPGAAKGVISMRDRSLFGGVAYRYHLRRGIAAGHVNDFRLELVAAATAGPAARADEVTPAQLLTAMGTPGVDKLLVFCRTIGHATRLADELRAAAADGARPAGVAPFECLVAHSKMGPGGAAAALRRFNAPGARAALFNCRLFQEGVEIPALNAVFFASPRHSPRDIIQSLCRPLNAAPGKPPSVVFVPVAHDPARRADDPANLQRFASIVPFADALLDEDPHFYEHLLDPEGVPYPIGLVEAALAPGAPSLSTTADGVAGPARLDPGTAARRAALLGAFRRAVRHGVSTAARPAERLLRAENLPWDRAFAELKRIVTVCGRYPKTVDTWAIGDTRVCIHRFYRWAADEFVKWRNGTPSKLEPHQIHDLLTLERFEPYGTEGPYPVNECLAFLERTFREKGPDSLLLNIKNGGYVGLDATAWERCSGFCTTINQGDGKARKGRPPGSGFTISAEKQAALDRICAPYNVRWRKERDATGELVKNGPRTFIQEAYARFKAYVTAHGADSELIQRLYPQFPLKHCKQERLDVTAAKLAPPRWRSGKRASKRITPPLKPEDGQ